MKRMLEAQQRDDELLKRVKIHYLLVYPLFYYRVTLAVVVCLSACHAGVAYCIDTAKDLKLSLVLLAPSS